MCGYCTEETALDILNSDVGGHLQMDELGSNLDRYFYLRESPDFISALDTLKRSMAQRRITLFSEIPHKVVLCRGLGVLLKQGYASPAYQLLLKKTQFRDAVVALCSEENRHQFELATKGLSVECLGILYDTETYFWGERSKELRILAAVLPPCRNLLRHYIAWWLDGKGLQKDESCVADAEHFRFDLLLRALYFSILVVGHYPAGKNMLQAIAQRNPIGTPAIEGDDLWLKRVAAAKVYGWTNSARNLR